MQYRANPRTHEKNNASAQINAALTATNLIANISIQEVTDSRSSKKSTNADKSACATVLAGNVSGNARPL
jgi:hypothetical protein